VVMDNLGAHKPERVQELIEEKGCRLWFLPAYSSNLSPIEEAFSKIKELLKKAVARTRQAFAEEAIAEALSAVTPQDTADGSLIASTEPSSTLMNML
jgi:transposase